MSGRFWIESVYADLKSNRNADSTCISLVLSIGFNSPYLLRRNRDYAPVSLVSYHRVTGTHHADNCV